MRGRRRRTGRLATAPWALASALLLVSLGGCAGNQHGASVTVPDVVGLHPDQAIGRICDAGLVPGTVRAERTGRRLSRAEQRPDAVMRASRVLASSPAAGSAVERGSAVDVAFRAPSNAAFGPLLPAACDLGTPS